MRRLLCGLVALALVIPAPALATPGQTVAQMEAWGKANPAFTDFSKKTSLGGYSAYRAFVEVGGHKGEYSALIDKTGVYGEYVTFSYDEPTSWDLAGHKSFMHDIIAKVYGDDYAADFDAAKKLPGVDPKEIYKGQKLAYIATLNSLLVVNLSEVPGILKNLNDCYDIFCSSQ